MMTGLAADAVNDQQLKGYLRSVGMACFVKYYCQFANNALTNQAVAEILLEREGYKEKASRSRVSTARSIIKAGRDRDALLIIASSAKVSDRIRERAKALADKIDAC